LFPASARIFTPFERTCKDIVTFRRKIAGCAGRQVASLWHSHTIEVFDMIRLPHLTTMAMGALALAGCATMNVSSHVRTGIDFTTYRTYDWGPADALPTGDPRLDQDPFFKDHMLGAVEKQLAARGFDRSASDSPDLLIHYHASINRRINVFGVDREHGYCFDEECQTWVTDYEAGTLVLDLVDPRTNRVIWRGWAQDGVEDMLDDRDRMAQKIDQAVARMMALLPTNQQLKSQR
jgi:hypothetical protein